MTRKAIENLLPQNELEQIVAKYPTPFTIISWGAGWEVELNLDILTLVADDVQYRLVLGNVYTREHFSEFLGEFSLYNWLRSLGYSEQAIEVHADGSIVGYSNDLMVLVNSPRYLGLVLWELRAEFDSWHLVNRRYREPQDYMELNELEVI